MLELEFDEDMLCGPILQVNVHDPGVLRDPVLLGLVRYVVFLPTLPFQREVYFSFFEKLQT